MSVETVPDVSAEESFSAGADAGAAAEASAAFWDAFSASVPLDAVRRVGALTVGMDGRVRRPEDLRASDVVEDDVPRVCVASAAVSASAEPSRASDARSEEKKTSTGRPLRPEVVFFCPVAEVGVPVLRAAGFFAVEEALPLAEAESAEFDAEDSSAAFDAEDAVEDGFDCEDDFEAAFPAEADVDGLAAAVFFDDAEADVREVPVFRAPAPAGVFEELFAGALSSAFSEAAAAADVARRRVDDVFADFSVAEAEVESEVSAGTLDDGAFGVSSVSAVLWIRAPRPRPRPPRRVFFTRPPEAKMVLVSLVVQGPPDPRRGCTVSRETDPPWSRGEGRAFGQREAQQGTISFPRRTITPRWRIPSCSAGPAPDGTLPLGRSRVSRGTSARGCLQQWVPTVQKGPGFAHFTDRVTSQRAGKSTCTSSRSDRFS